MRKKIFLRHWWENQIKYQPLAQRLFLLLNLSNQFPATLNIEPTNICNFDCSFCPIKKTNRPKGFMELKLYRKIIDRISQEKKLKVLWLNKDGEPLLHPKIDWMVDYSKKKKVADRIEIYTNGSLLNDKMAKKLIKAKLDSLVVSLDATSRESFKKLKKKDAYDQVVANIHQFLQIRSRFKAKKPLLSLKMIDLGEPRQVDKFRKLWEGVADCVVIQPLHSWEGSVKISSIKQQTSNIKRYPCNLPWLAPAINWEGTVVPCCVNFRQNELILGDVKKNSFKEIFQGEKFKKLRYARLQQDFSQWPTCARCQYWQQLPNMDFWLRRIGV